MDFITAINAGLAAKNIKNLGSKVAAGVKKKTTEDPEDINEEKEPTLAGLAAENIKKLGSKAAAGIREYTNKNLNLTDSYDPDDSTIGQQFSETANDAEKAYDDYFGLYPSGSNKTSPTGTGVQTAAEKEPTRTEPTASPSGSKKTRPTTPFVQTAAEKAELDNVMLGATTGGTELMNRPSRSQEADKLVPGDSTYDMSSPFLGTRGVQRMDNGAEAAMPKKSNPYGDFGGEPYDAAPTFETPNPNFAGALTGDADRKGVAPLDITDTASRAIPVETYETLFKKTHGGPFDPKSRVDREKMAVIQSMIDEDKSLLKLSPTQFALKVYGRK